MKECDGRVSQGQVLQNDIEAHGNCEWEHQFDIESDRDEHAKGRAREDVEGQCRYKEVECSKGDLAMAERWVVENGFIRKDLRYVSPDLDFYRGVVLRLILLLPYLKSSTEAIVSW